MTKTPVLHLGLAILTVVLPLDLFAYSRNSIKCHQAQVQFIFGEHADTCSELEFDRFIDNPSLFTPQGLRSATQKFAGKNKDEIRLMKIEADLIKTSLEAGKITWLGLEETEQDCRSLGCTMEERMKKMSAFHDKMLSSGVSKTMANDIMLLYFGAGPYVLWSDSSRELRKTVKYLVPLDEEKAGKVTAKHLCDDEKPSDAEEEQAMVKRNRTLLQGVGRASMKYGDGLVTFGEYHEEIFGRKKSFYQRHVYAACERPVESSRLETVR